MLWIDKPKCHPSHSLRQFLGENFTISFLCYREMQCIRKRKASHQCYHCTAHHLINPQTSLNATSLPTCISATKSHTSHTLYQSVACVFVKSTSLQHSQSPLARSAILFSFSTLTVVVAQSIQAAYYLHILDLDAHPGLRLNEKKKKKGNNKQPGVDHPLKLAYDVSSVIKPVINIWSSRCHGP